MYTFNCVSLLSARKAVSSVPKKKRGRSSSPPPARSTAAAVTAERVSQQSQQDQVSAKKLRGRPKTVATPTDDDRQRRKGLVLGDVEERDAENSDRVKERPAHNAGSR